MALFVKHDSEIESLICCPFSKGQLDKKQNFFLSRDSGFRFPLINSGVGEIIDLRIPRPEIHSTESLKNWKRVQQHYETVDDVQFSRDDLDEYLNEIDSVKEIYTKEFKLTGRVLDVGGQQGRLRHFLDPAEVPLYISVDPFIDVFRDNLKPNLLKAYPSLAEPCNFLACHAEYLPFIPNSFDWVHMRSCIDHFADPFLALKEAYRVLKPGGTILIGVSIMKGLSKEQYSGLYQRIFGKLKTEGIKPTFRAIVEKVLGKINKKYDDHNFRFSHDELVYLLKEAGFDIEKEHWQKPPFTYVLYISAKKII